MELIKKAKQMKNKTIAFERWLIHNYPEHEDNPDYECDDCDGTGITEEYEGQFQAENCVSCSGTGSAMYDEYKKQCVIDQERLRKFTE